MFQFLLLLFPRGQSKLYTIRIFLSKWLHHPCFRSNRALFPIYPPFLYFSCSLKETLQTIHLFVLYPGIDLSHRLVHWVGSSLRMLCFVQEGQNDYSVRTESNGSSIRVRGIRPSIPGVSGLEVLRD